MKSKSKEQLLEHYACKEPTPFIQFDGFDMGPDSDDCVMHADDDGHCIMSCETYELMMSCPTVRVLIPAGVGITPATASAILHKIADIVLDQPQFRFRTEEEIKEEVRGLTEALKTGIWPDIRPEEWTEAEQEAYRRYFSGLVDAAAAEIPGQPNEKR